MTNPRGRGDRSAVDHLGATLPAGTAADAQAADFGDAIWAGDYNDPDAYTGGVPVELTCQLDITERLRAFKERKLLAILHTEFAWALRPQLDLPEHHNPDIWWLAS